MMKKTSSAPEPRLGPVYIAGPYGPANGQSPTENTARAVRLARFAVETGWVPFVIHPAILAGAYGDDADAFDRERGLRVAQALARTVGMAGGHFWVIATGWDDEAPVGGGFGAYRLSRGTGLELAAYRNAYMIATVVAAAEGREVLIRTWSHWKALIHADDVQQAHAAADRGEKP